MGLFKKGVALPLKRAKHDLSDDVHVYIREMTAQEQIKFQTTYEVETPNSKTDFLWEILALCLCDADGLPLFASKEEVAEYFTISVSLAEQLVNAILDLSGCQKKT